MAMSFDANSANHVNPITPSQPDALELPKPIAIPPPAPTAEPASPPVEDFDALVKGEVQAFVDLGHKIGDLVAEQVLK
jgi:adenylyl cyclase-associated protein